MIYEVLWMKELSLLFGNSTQAAAATLAAFFSGIAAGNAFWGRKATRLRRPLMVYGLLELGVTASALIFFAVITIYDALYPTLYSLFAGSATAFTVTKFILALILFFIPSFFMGGTLPVMTQHLVRHKESLGRRASVLYAINTVGAACGGVAAGFYLPQALGIDTSYIVAMLMTCIVGIIGVILGRAPSYAISEASPPTHKLTSSTRLTTLPVLAGLSGFASLALQVLWIRMFAQVLHNSVYTYSAILSVFLVSLALGGAIARLLAHGRQIHHWLLPLLLTTTALSVAISPMLFYWLTDGSSYIGGDASFNGYMLQILGVTVLTIGIPTMTMGILLPYLFKLAEAARTGPGETVGNLVTVNTLGAICGSIVAGFVMLEVFGLWGSIRTIALLYIAAAIWLAITQHPTNLARKLTPIAGLLVVFFLVDSDGIPVVKINEENEKLLKVWQGADATVAVIERSGHLRTKLNNWYTLGSTGDMATQQVQTHLPMLLHQNPKQIFYLGLGTGITAGTALSYPIHELVIAEISPSAIRASEQFFAQHTNNLFQDERVEIIAEDGRNVLRGTTASYDLVISDLFIPWKSGTGTLYSVEHYKNAKQRLKPGGLYAQWLPLYQLTGEEFSIIAKSMLEAFPLVTMWRGNFRGDRPVLALVGHKDSDSALSTETPLLEASRFALGEHLQGNGDTVPLLAHYAGMLRIDDSQVIDAPVNTDNHPIIEYLAPINHRREKAGERSWFSGMQLFEFVAPYLTEDALSKDAYLKDLNKAWHEAIQAGYYLHAHYELKKQQHADASSARATFQMLLQQVARSLASENSGER